jgi:hypothetical protein
MDQFFKMAVTEEFDGNATVDEAIAKLGLKSQYDMIPGMVVPLMPHQSIGVAWMLEKEASKLKGGALSDEMGLGKVCNIHYTFAVSDCRLIRPFKCESRILVLYVQPLIRFKDCLDGEKSRNRSIMQDESCHCSCCIARPVEARD